MQKRLQWLPACFPFRKGSLRKGKNFWKIPELHQTDKGGKTLCLICLPCKCILVSKHQSLYYSKLMWSHLDIDNFLLRNENNLTSCNRVMTRKCFRGKCVIDVRGFNTLPRDGIEIWSGSVVGVIPSKPIHWHQKNFVFGTSTSYFNKQQKPYFKSHSEFQKQCSHCFVTGSWTSFFRVHVSRGLKKGTLPVVCLCTKISTENYIPGFTLWQRMRVIVVLYHK